MKFSTCTIASFGSTMRKYATAFTRTGTLSFVITSCGGMFSVIVRRSTLTIRSTIGISRKRPGPFGSGKQPAEPEDDAALVLARDLDRRDQEEDDEEEDDGEGDESGGHDWNYRTVSSSPSTASTWTWSPGTSSPPSARCACQSSPPTRTWPGVAHDGLFADDAVRADGDRPPPHLHRLRERERPRTRRAGSSTDERRARPRCGTARARCGRAAACPTDEADQPGDGERAVRHDVRVDHEQRDPEQDQREAGPARSAAPRSRRAR